MIQLSEKTKKQHYVPRCYLEAWAISNKYQVHVYDTEIEKARINSINDGESRIQAVQRKHDEMSKKGLSPAKIILIDAKKKAAASTYIPS